MIACLLITLSCKEDNVNENGVIESSWNGSETKNQKNSKNQTISDQPSPPSSVQTIEIEQLKEAYKDKNDQLFLKQFPADFQQFMDYFGWNNKSNQPNELYEESYAYIDYFFHLLSQEKFREFESKLIGIADNGVWQEDGVNFFQDLTLKYIKVGERYELIDDLRSNKAKSVLFFLFDGPHPKVDSDFASHLSPAKKEILETLFESGFYDDNENPDPIDQEVPMAYDISDFENAEHYFIRDIDINKDEILDKIVSADPYQGDELFLFIKKGDEYLFALKTINFSEDGGNQIMDVQPEEDGFVIKTVFPDGGILEADHHIIFKDQDWILTHTVYRTQSSKQQDAFIYVCDVKQGLSLKDRHLVEQLQWMPKEAQREMLCTKEKIN